MTSSPRDAIATIPGAFFCSTASRSTKSIEFPGFAPLPAASVRITIPAKRRCRQQASPHRPSNRLHPFHSRPLSYVQLLAHDDHQSFSFLFRLRQPSVIT
jgi:hypothetical protein